jgi:hypothetical protein
MYSLSRHTALTHHLSPGLLTTGQVNQYVSEFLASSVPHTITHSFILASTEVLHEKITELCTCVRDLKDVLQTLHGQSSTNPHLLLFNE